MRNARSIFALRSLLRSSRLRYSTYLFAQNKQCKRNDFKHRFVKRLSFSSQPSLQNAAETDIKQQIDVFPDPKKILWRIINEAFAATQKSEIKPTVTVQQISHENERLWKVTLLMNWPERFQVEGKAAKKLEAENLAYQNACQKMKVLGILDSNNKPVLQKDIVTFGDSNLRVAKGILSNIFQRIWMKHGKKEYIPEYNTQMVSGIFGKENYWKSELLLKYPEEKRFEGSSTRLRDAEAIAAIKALHWLFEKGIINRKNRLVEVSKSEEAKLAASHFAPHSICIPPDLQDKMEAISTQVEAEKTGLCFQDLNKNEIDVSESPTIIHDIITEKVYCEPSEEEVSQRSREMYENHALLQHCNEPEFQELKTFRAQLPINQKRAEILNLLEENQVVVLSGETGCGKTTQVPQFIFEDYIKKMKGALCNIVVTQPRRISAISIAECVASERNEKVGDTIGYQVRLNKNLPQKKGAILYCTTGMLLRKMCSNPKLQGVSHIIVDEIHERNIPIDFILILLKKILEENKSIKLLMMSASFNTFTFSQYFNNCPVIHIPGKIYPIKEYFLEDLHYEIPGVKYIKPKESVLNADLVTKVINYIHTTQKPGAILCFLPGWHEIQTVHSKLLSTVEDASKLIIFPAHSRLPPHEQQKIFKAPPFGSRKVILATNIAETSITINDVVYVVNCGLHKGTSFDCERGIASLGTQWITKANVRQRRGRAGRLQPGLCYHLFDRKTFMMMDEYPTPELLRAPLESVILDCKLYCPDSKAEDFLSMALQPPSKSALQAGISELQLSSILNEEENLTPLGKIIVNFGTHPRLSVALIYATFLRCLDPVLTICAMLTLGKEPFLNNVEDKSLIKEVKMLNDNYLFSDHLALARIFTHWEKMDNELEVTEYVEKNLLDDISLKYVKELKSLFAENLFTVGAINSPDAFSHPLNECNINSSHIPSIFAALTAAFYPNVMKIVEGDISHGRLNKDCISYSLLNGQRGHIQRESVASKECELPSPWFIYFNALKSDARRMIMTPAVSSVPGICLALFAGKELTKIWEKMGGAVSAGEDNDELIDNLVEAEYIKSPIVERIFRAVDRGDYYLEGCKENAYRDLAWKSGHIHLSAPCIYSEVMESLKLGAGMSFLNLGSGTGYLSTMAGLLLGTYGTNHGVELHSDVVNYAKTKLDEFLTTSPAMDKYEFCTPNFVVGNCLLLDSSIHQYDRVYCGASCPAEHENYMKNLVRIGGILVMPLNDHLLQVTRTGETTYEVKNVLPVSFASLVVPSSNEAFTSVKLPETHPLSLQEICRSAIRVLLRRNVEIENPTLKDKKKPPHPKRKRGRRRMKRIVIPIFEEMRNSDGNNDSRRGSRSDLDDSRRESQSDVEASKNDSQVEAGDSGRGSQNDVDDSRRVAQHPPVVTQQNGKIVLNLDYNCAEPKVAEQKMEVADEDDTFVEETFPEYNKKMEAECSTTWVEGKVLPTTDSGIDNISDDSVIDECPSDSEKTDAGSSNPSSSHEPEEGATRNPLYLKRSAEDDDDEDDASDLRTNGCENKKYPNYRSTAVIFKRVAFSDVESDEFDDIDSDSGKDCFPLVNKEESKEKSDLSGYTCFMRQKISQLPLPHSLKMFLNFSRPV